MSSGNMVIVILQDVFRYYQWKPGDINLSPSPLDAVVVRGGCWLHLHEKYSQAKPSIPTTSPCWEKQPSKNLGWWSFSRWLPSISGQDTRAMEGKARGKEVIQNLARFFNSPKRKSSKTWPSPLTAATLVPEAPWSPWRPRRPRRPGHWFWACSSHKILYKSL